MMPHVIWLLLDSRTVGGIETHVFQLANGIQQAGHTVKVVLITDYGDHPLIPQCHSASIPLLQLDGRFKTLVHTLRTERPTLLHTHGYKAGIWGRVAGVLTGVPTFSTFHAGEPGHGKVACYDWLDRHTAWLARGRFAVSEPIAARIPCASTVLDNFINTEGLTPSSGTQIAFVGRLSHEKGADRFLALAALYPEQSFHIYGDGPLATSLMAAATSNVVFHGQQDMAQCWDKIGVLVMPSRHEGLPMAALEAMARGIPLIASKVGALPVLITDELHGWLINQALPTRYAHALNQWLALPVSQRRVLSNRVAQRIQERFSSQAVIPTLLKLYTGEAL